MTDPSVSTSRERSSRTSHLICDSRVVVFQEGGEDVSQFPVFSLSFVSPFLSKPAVQVYSWAKNVNICEPESRRYLTVGQYVAAMKALMFGDERSYKAIVDPPPRLNTSVAYFRRWSKAVEESPSWNAEQWSGEHANVVYQGCVLKFSSTTEMALQLLATGSKVIGYATPLDSVWGTGVGAPHKGALDTTIWTGTNMLGTILMHARAHLSSNLDLKELSRQLASVPQELYTVTTSGEAKTNDT